MDGRKLKTLAAVLVGALAVILLVALSQAAPPGPHPRPHPRPVLRHGPVVRGPRAVLRHRHRPVVRRYAPRVIVGPAGTVVRRPPPPVVINTVSDLRTVPAVEVSESTAYKVAKISSDGLPVVSIDGKPTSVRLIGVDPATADNAGDAASKEAQAFLANLVAGEFVYLEYDASLAEADEDGNRVAYMYRAPDKMFVNLELVRRGYALAADDYDYEHKELFSFYESKAAGDSKGIWASDSSAKPTASSGQATDSPTKAANSQAGGSGTATGGATTSAE